MWTKGFRLYGHFLLGGSDMSIWTHVTAVFQFFPTSDNVGECIGHLREKFTDDTYWEDGLGDVNVPKGSEGSCEVLINRIPHNECYIVTVVGDLRDVGDEYLADIEDWFMDFVNEGKAMEDIDWENTPIPPVMLKNAMLRADVKYGHSIVMTDEQIVLKAPRDEKDMKAIGGWWKAMKS